MIFFCYFPYLSSVTFCVDSVRMDFQLHQKISKCRFFQDIQNSFLEATDIGLKPHQNFFRKKILTIPVARAVWNLGRNGLLWAGWLSNGKDFFIKIEQTCNKEMVKISERYFDLYLSNCQLTENLKQRLSP